eukprot:CAMPEP_0180785676 /NCGR_PEP_ID=MMETSP1038_2-20121128/50346_1 /TAXON_ID=632150 /ORGANISM="Azadinium spinosum, Strain 3D9" /LENGTH=95 /DNA_ID=CAMNT_0022822651 /DNA_START=94 /DNA_END=382 /DNA_ORIENTATION=+
MRDAHERLGGGNPPKCLHPLHCRSGKPGKNNPEVPRAQPGKLIQQTQLLKDNLRGMETHQEARAVVILILHAASVLGVNENRWESIVEVVPLKLA